MNIIKNKIILIILVFIFSIFNLWKNIINYQNIYKPINYKTNYLYKNKLYNLNRVIIIGDSRMELINNDRISLKVPNNFIFKAQSGARIIWLYQVGLPWLNEQLKDINYNYIVIFNLGVNDLNSNQEVREIAKNYFNAYKYIIDKNKNITFYFLSVNPIIESIIEEYFPNQKRTNNKIEIYNQYFINKINEEKKYNVKYCDSYNNLDFVLYDGLHYDFNTNKNIINYIINNCINLNYYNNFLLNNFY